MVRIFINLLVSRKLFEVLLNKHVINFYQIIYAIVDGYNNAGIPRILGICDMGFLIKYS